MEGQSFDRADPTSLSEESNFWAVGANNKSLSRYDILEACTPWRCRSTAQPLVSNTVFMIHFYVVGALQRQSWLPRRLADYILLAHCNVKCRKVYEVSVAN